MFRFRLCWNRPLVALASSILFNRSSSEKPTPIEEPPRTPLQHINCTGFECIRESSMLALSSSSSFLKHTLYYYSELTRRYCVQISSMIVTLKEFARLEGFGHSQQEIWDIYVKDRLELNEMKSELLRLRLLLSTIEKMVTETIDAAYQTNDETITQLVSNELNNATRIIAQNERLISEHEMALTGEQVKLIEISKEEEKSDSSKIGTKI